MSHFHRIETAIVIASALLSLLFYARLPAAFPSAEDEAAVRARIAAAGQAGEAILLAPHWAERARLFGFDLPVLNLSRGATPEDLAGWTGLFVLAFDDLPRADRAAAFELVRRAGFELKGRVETFGKLSLAHFRQAAPRAAIFRASEALDQASASVETAHGERLPCRREGRGLRCPGGGRGQRSSLLRGEIREIHFKPYRCISAAPAPGGPLAIEFRGVPLGTSLDLLAGPIGQANLRRQARAPITFSAAIDAEEVGRWSWNPGEPEERRASIDTRGLTGGAHALRFEIAGDARHPIDFCFEAEVRR